jgi:phosphoglycolate phosphatase
MAVLNDIGGVLFDLDGTFADTAHDLAFALNQTLHHFGREQLPFDAIRPVVSHGGIALIRLGFDLGPDDKGYTPRREHLLRVYQDNIARQTRLFDGMEQVIDTLEAAGIPWGIVTNKPAWLTDPLMEAMRFTQRTNCIVSGDTCDHSKPHPQPMLHAASLIRTDPGACLYLGDARRDIEAGKAAGMKTAAAAYGYIEPHDPAESWDADWLITHPLELLAILHSAA